MAAGVNIGSEQDGKGNNFTRPALVVALYGQNLALVVFTTSRKLYGQYYRRIVVNGQPRTLILNQLRVIDRRRIGDYLDEISEQQLQGIRSEIAKIILNPPPIKEDLSK